MKKHILNHYNSIKQIMVVDEVDETIIIKTYNEGIDAVITLVKESMAGLNKEICALKTDNQKLNDRISELEVRINKNSSNSSKPPSSDSFVKPRNSREKSGKPTGGQPGHKGYTLLKVDKPDEIIELKPRNANVVDA
jgi:transposase